MSHHNEKADKKAQKKTNDTADMPDKDEDDVEGHSLLTMSDAFVKSRMPSKGELEREARRQAELKEARANRRG